MSKERRRKSALVLALVSWACTAPLANAGGAGPSPLRHLGAVSGTSDTGPVLASDGRRWALWHDGQRVHLFDDRTGKHPPLSGIDDCVSALRPSIVMATRGAALIQCWNDEQDFDPPFLEHYVFDSALSPPRARRLTTARPRDYFVRIGRHWSEGSVDPSSTRTDNLVLLNWRTGERRAYDTEGCFDLDSAIPKELSPSACAKRERVLTDGNLALRHRQTRRRRDHLEAIRGSRLLSRINAKSCGAVRLCSMQIGAGWATFARATPTRSSVTAFSYDSRQSFTWRLPRASNLVRPRGPYWLSARHTSRYVLVAIPIEQSRDSLNGTYASRYRLLRARMPLAR